VTVEADVLPCSEIHDPEESNAINTASIAPIEISARRRLSSMEAPYVAVPAVSGTLQIVAMIIACPSVARQR